MVMTEFWCWWFLVFLAVVGEQRYSGCWVPQWLVNDGIMVVGIEISFFFFPMVEISNYGWCLSALRSVAIGLISQVFFWVCNGSDGSGFSSCCNKDWWGILNSKIEHFL